MANFKVALKGYFSHDAFHKRRLARPVFAHKGHLLSSLYGEGDIVKHIVFAIGLAHLLGYHRIVARARGWRKFESQAGGVDLVDLNGNDFGQLLDAALHLYGFGGLVTELLNKLLCVVNHLLLILVGTHLLLDALFTQLHKMRIVHIVVVNLAARYLDGAVGHVVDKRSVVTHEQQRVGM